MSDNELPVPAAEQSPAAAQAAGAGVTVAVVGEQDLEELLALVRGYCDFYEVSPSDQRLLALSRALISDPERQGIQLIARDERGLALGFATLYWSWSTSQAAPVGTMNDLYVLDAARGRGVGEQLIAACLRRCARHGAHEMEWQTAPGNMPAQALYDRVGGRRQSWLSYSLEVPRR